MAQVTLQGKPFTLVGTEKKVGEKAPDFEVVNNEMLPVKLSSFKGKPLLILSVPSLDTSVCSKEARRFNVEVEKLGDIQTLVISMDLPFAQKRWCAAEGIKNITTASDHIAADFGQKYGVLIKELRLLARAVFLVDATGTLKYIHLCKEVTEEPPYEAVIKQVAALLAGAK